MNGGRDHGGGLDAAVAQYGGPKSDWLDLSTGINPVPYPVGPIPAESWTALPDTAARDRLIRAARTFWNVPDTAEIVAAPGASSLIARMPALSGEDRVHIPGPTYNEHAAAFRAHGRQGGEDPRAPVHVHVHPNNPDGRLCPAGALGGRALTIIDESFCDVMPERSHVARTAEQGVVVLKSFGKFWGLAGLRLGFAIGRRETLRPKDRPSIEDLLGPWSVSGPALDLGARALGDESWAQATRARLAQDSARLDAIMHKKDARSVGGATLFRLYEVDDAQDWQDRLARGKVWSRIFPYSTRWLRLGLPAPERWQQLEAAL
ncbi:threonine-phosphate decarboxylase [Celeribacter indicus]|uniref:Aminotransferase n=1 Tax=Celeribacter indicus TaxID=1208324 RepID=A0A0B5DVV1_9RHOB|nr:threonine-phosphate decarboxylase [Celeribacter indicus]AJE45300.1 aminotransferase [Celeribacter indicus]SDX20454.1 L-threonine O-3-phosphate decarboxylase [Celeribacter indicus]